MSALIDQGHMIKHRIFYYQLIKIKKKIYLILLEIQKLYFRKVFYKV